ncbi:cytochrome c oxidase subunit 5B, mitochondrial-like isoform X2 [Tigriopus californicus]|uniref:cytochrome c oxidase subunit 5B, mitochondrial-like isoform X2 n=1 Tax=Tigriopus californicus TaxID=6832 RepID=UPI0027DA3E3E|nr:cytochrome c oxidase subunit 5B, mitochondrial-like isoform X2 [Tigriopus californicus]
MASNLLLRSSSRLVGSCPWAQATQKSLTTSAVIKKDYVMADPLDHATGVEKFELLAKKEGNDDPFFLRSKPRGKGTKDDPTIVNALDTYRMVGCVCSKTDTNIKWMWLYENKPKRCECGYWFQLKAHPAPDRYKMPL